MPIFTYEKARILAQTWVDLRCNFEAQIIDEATITKPYGWVFFYESKIYLETGDVGEFLVGNAPILIDRVNAELITFGTSYLTEHYIQEYEKTIPKARLQMKPEFPPNNDETNR